MFEHDFDGIRIGFVEAIARFHDNEEILIVLRDTILSSTCDELDFDNDTVHCTNVLTVHPHSSRLLTATPL